MITPKPCGSFLEVGDDGFVIPKASYDLLQPKWKTIVDQLIDLYKEHFGENLHSVWLRGSAAKGVAEDGCADLDTFAYLHNPLENWPDEFCQAVVVLEKENPFCLGIEYSANPVANLKLNHDCVMSKVIKTQSACLFGEDLRQKIDPYTLKDMLHYSHYIKFNVEQKLPQLLKEDRGNEQAIKEDCNWVGKLVLRTLFELVMLDVGKWTNDLWPCYESFSKRYPQREANAMNLLNLCLNPVSDENQINQAVDVFFPWLYDEIKEKLSIESVKTY